MDQPKDIVSRFESLGDNCEFGFVQRKYGAEPGGLLRWAVSPLVPLLAALGAEFENFYLLDELRPTADDMVSCERYGLAFHTSMRSQRIDDVRRFTADLAKRKELYEVEIVKMSYLREKLLERLRLGDVIFVYKSNQNVSEPNSRRLLADLRVFNKKNELLIVMQDESLPEVRLVEEGLYFGYVDRFAPYNKANEVSYDRWLTICTHTLAISASE